MSKENPTRAEKCRSTKLSKCNVPTLVGIILRKDSKEKALKTKIDLVTEANTVISQEIKDYESKLKSLEGQLKQFSAIFSTNKEILDSTRRENKRLNNRMTEMSYEFSRKRHRIIYNYIISVILINIMWISVILMK